MGYLIAGTVLFLLAIMGVVIGGSLAYFIARDHKKT
jgi:prolipoprotein diacylglyceryltransferase